MADLGDLQRVVDYALESIEERAERIGKRLLRHWYAGCALAGAAANRGILTGETLDLIADAAIKTMSKEPKP